MDLPRGTESILNMNLHGAEKVLLQYALNKYRWNLTLVAKHLGLGRSTVYRKLKIHGLNKP